MLVHAHIVALYASLCNGTCGAIKPQVPTIGAKLTAGGIGYQGCVPNEGDVLPSKQRKKNKAKQKSKGEHKNNWKRKIYIELK